MTIQKMEFLKKLGLCMSGIEKGNPILQGADSFIFHNNRIFAYNDVISVSVPIEDTDMLSNGLEGAVSAEEFYKIISKMPNEEIRFEAGDKSWTLRSGKAKAELALIEFDYERRLNEIHISDDWIELSDDFFTGLSVCRMARNATPLSGIFVKGDSIMSTDGYRINRFTVNCKLPEFWISDKSLAELLKFDKLNKIQSEGSSNWVHFKSENDVVFSLKTLVTAKYPFDKCIELLDDVDLNSLIRGKFPSGIKGAIERASVFNMNLEQHSAVKMVIGGEGVEVVSENATGNYSEMVAWDDGKKDYEEMAIYVDTEMIVSSSDKTLEFYLQVLDNRPPRLYFKTDSSLHLMSTLTAN